MSTPLPPLTRAKQAHLKNLFKERRARQADGTFVVEGAKAVRDILRGSGNLVRTIVTTPEYRAKESSQDRSLRVSLSAESCSCPEPTFSRLSEVEEAQGILAIVQQPVWDERAVFAEPTLFGIFCERIQDPLNIGTIVRTAAGLGASALWLTSDSADLFSPKVVRGTAGALLSLPTFQAETVDDFLRNGCAIVAADASNEGTIRIGAIESVPRRLILAVGNEGRGLSERTKQAAVCRFRIPLSREVESLNVAVTTAIALHVLGGLPKR